MDEIKKIRFIDFFKKIWWWNVLLDFILLLISIYGFIQIWNGNKTDLNNLYMIGVSFLIGSLQFIFLVVLLIMHFVKKRFIIASALLLHLIGLFFLLYLFSALFMIAIFPA